MNAVSGIRRNIKNVAHNYTDAQVKVREATSNDPWGPPSSLMSEISDLTYNAVAFSEITQMIWKRLNDHGKNYRHVYKALVLLDYLVKTGNEKVAQQCKENIFAIHTLRDFQYYEDGKDQGIHVRQKSKTLEALLKDDERLKNERIKALKARERFAQQTTGFGTGSDSNFMGSPSAESFGSDPTGLATRSIAAVAPTDLDLARPQTAGEEELQLELALSMSHEEAEKEEEKRRSDDVRLVLAISQSQEAGGPVAAGSRPAQQPQQQQSHLLDLLDVNVSGATTGWVDPWGTPAHSSEPPVPIMLTSHANSWTTGASQNGFGGGGQFASDNSSATAFGASANGSTNGFDAFGDLLQPSGVSGVAAGPQTASAKPASSTSNKVLTGDLDSSLASLAMNLTINKSQPSKAGQFGPTATNKTGVPVQQPGAGQWNPQPMMGMSMGSVPMTMQAGQMAYRPMVPMALMTAMTAPYAANQPMNPAMVSGIRPGMSIAGPISVGCLFSMTQPGMPMSSSIRPAANQQLDPFGTL